VSFRLQNFWSFGGSWKKLDEEFGEDYMTELDGFLCSQPANGFYPAGDDIFRAFEETRLDTVKVVILGQDPPSTCVGRGSAPRLSSAPLAWLCRRREWWWRLFRPRSS
jgi:uracil DNA glycosylase